MPLAKTSTVTKDNHPTINVKRMYPCRDEIIDGLSRRLDTLRWPFMVINGSHCTGKTTITRSLLEAMEFPFSWTNCLEIVSLRSLQHKILLDLLGGYSLDNGVVIVDDSDDDGYGGEGSRLNRCTSNEKFISNMETILSEMIKKVKKKEKQGQQTKSQKSSTSTTQSKRRTTRESTNQVAKTAPVVAKDYKYFVVLDNYEKLMAESINLLPILNEIHGLMKESSLTLICLLITTMSFDRLIPYFSTVPQPLVFTFSNFTRDQLPLLVSSLRSKEFDDTYEGYSDVVTGTLSSAISDITKLSYICETSFEEHYQKNNGASKDVDRQLRKHFNEHVDDYVSRTISMGKAVGPASTKTTLANTNELPLSTKYLLIAAFIASYNPKTSDKKLFVVLSDKRKTSRTARRKEHTITGPKLFTLERLLHLYESLIYLNVSSRDVDEIRLMEPTNHLLSQIETLVSLKVLIKASSATISPLSSLTKYQISDSVTYEYIEELSKTVNFKLKEHLS